jgi:crossover junction endodeoxyribonuclease RusA
LSREWVLVLPYLKPLSMNDRPTASMGAMHARRREIKAWRNTAHLLALSARIPRLSRFTVEYHYRPAVNRNRDPQNLARGLKPLVDGLVDAGVSDDDNPAHYTGTEPTIHPAVKGQPARLWLVVRDLSETQGDQP